MVIIHYPINWEFTLDNTVAAMIDHFNFILLAGDYKTVSRLFDDTNNHTYILWEFKFNIKPSNGIEFDKFRMGK